MKRQKNLSNKRTILYYLALTITFLGLILILVFGLSRTFSSWLYDFEPEIASNFGEFIGGFVGSLFSLAGVLLLFETLRRQRKEFHLQQFEGKFFNLLSLHRNNIDEMRIKEITGRMVFVEMKKEFTSIFRTVSDVFDVPMKDKINISYLTLYFGVGPNSSPVLYDKLKKAGYKYDKVYDLIQYLENKRKISYKKDKHKGYLKFDGNQSRLGHYFRHLYQVIKYIDIEDGLSDEEKKFYIKIIRSQLSTFELYIFFFSSLSSIGKLWKNYIEKYDLIKCLPPILAYKINPKDFYPSVNYEWDDDEASEKQI